MVLFRQCPRCGGDLSVEEDLLGSSPDLVCFQCGYRKFSFQWLPGERSDLLEIAGKKSARRVALRLGGTTMTEMKREGTLDQIKGRVRAAWGELSDDDFDKARGNIEELVGRIKERTGQSIESIRARVDRLLEEDQPEEKEAPGQENEAAARRVDL